MIGEGPQRAQLADGRSHFQHGPIDLIIDASGDEGQIERAINCAWNRFSQVLAELVEELPQLRTDIAEHRTPPNGSIARRMANAVRPFSGVFITPMAAVAGSVADEMISYFRDETNIGRAYVNNGGDIALHLTSGSSYRVGVFGDVSRIGHALGSEPQFDARINIDLASGVRGIATSGWQGRSHSLGIADSVTVLAKTAAEADAAATVIANCVDAHDPLIQRRPARQLRSDSDLGDRLVTVEVPRLEPAVIEQALESGATRARELLADGSVIGAYLLLQDRYRIVVKPDRLPMLSAAA